MRIHVACACFVALCGGAVSAGIENKSRFRDPDRPVRDAQPFEAGTTAIFEQLPADGFEMALDVSRGRLYVSIPDEGIVMSLSSATFEAVDEFAVGGTPQGIALSVDGTRLFVALRGEGAVAVIDLEDESMDFIGIESELDDNRTYDVLEVEPDRLFVTANPGGNGFAYVVQVRLDLDNAAERVASNTIIRSRPELELSPDGQSLYVGTGFTPNSLYKLDLGQPDAPVVLEDDHGSVSGTQNLEISPDGTRIYLASGQVLSTASFAQVGVVGPGVSQFGTSADLVYVVDAPHALTVFGTPGFTTIADIQLPCDFDNIRQMLVLPEDSGWVVLGDDVVCGRLGGDLCDDAPNALSTPGPAEQAINVSVGSALTWTGGEANCLSLFDVRLGTQNPPTTTACEDLSYRACAPGQLAPLTTYYWQVEAVNSAGSTLGPVWSFTTNECAQPVLPQDLATELPAPAFDMAIDEDRNLLYVSLPSLSRIALVSLETLQVLEVLDIGIQPHGLDISSDGARLFAALHWAGAVAVMDLETHAVTEIEIGEEMGSYSTLDVVEGTPDRVFAVGFNSWVTMIRLDQGDAAQRISHRILGTPVLATSPDAQSLYLGEGINVIPNSLYKFDLTQPDAPIVLEDDHGSISGASHLGISLGSDQIYLESGQVLDTSTFEELHHIDGGIAQFGDDPDTVFAAGTPNSIESYSSVNGEFLDHVSVACLFSEIQRLHVMPEGGGFIVLGDDKLCYYGIPDQPAAPEEPSPGDDALAQPLDAVLSWRSGDGACLYTEYEVLFGEDNPPTTPLCSVTTQTSCDPGPLEYNQTYHWQVVAHNRGGSSPGPIWAFTTESCDPCGDTDSDGIRDDNCVWWDCQACQTTEIAFADMGGPLGACFPDEQVDGHDRDLALSCFAGNTDCDTINIDAGGAFGNCAPDGFCNVHDANHVLNVIAGTNACSCPSGPMPEGTPDVVGEVVLRVDVRPETQMREGLLSVDVFMDGDRIGMRSYQLEVAVSGGSAGQLELVDIRIEDRKDAVFRRRSDTFGAFNVTAGQMLSGLEVAQDAIVTGSAYLATFDFRAGNAARGEFVIDLRVDEASGDQTFLLGDSNSRIAIATVLPAVVDLDGNALQIRDRNRHRSQGALPRR